MNIVVDTNILIDHLRGGDAWEKNIAILPHSAVLILPSVILCELYSGKSSADQANAGKITRLLSFFQIADMNTAIAKRAGTIYRDISQTLDVPDYIIAATALELGAPVLTANKKHFRQVPGLQLW